jgi:Arc/MetJ-type ribon-helix-helix transcriptional regulator
MKVSLSIPIEDLEYVDEQARLGRFPSRSAAVQAAIRLMRDREYADSYAEAWDEWDASGEGALWGAALADGLTDAAR